MKKGLVRIRLTIAALMSLSCNDEVRKFVLQHPGGTCHVCIRGCAFHVFGSEISLESHFLGV